MNPPQSVRSQALRGIFWMVLAAGAYALSAGMVRKLSPEFTAFELVFLRTVVGLAMLLPWLVLRIGAGGLRTQRLNLFLLRGTFTYFAMVSTFYALGHMPVAEVYALQFTLPLFSILLAVLVLGERAGLGSWLACIIGFLGTVVILRPGFDEISAAALAALASAALYGGSNVCIKALSRTESAALITVYANIIMLPLSLVPALFTWHTPEWRHVPWLLALGITNTLGQLVLARAIAAADARIVWPFDFLRLPFAVVIGYVLFAELPGPWTWAGAVIIFSSSYYVVRREAGARQAGGAGTGETGTGETRGPP